MADKSFFQLNEVTTVLTTDITYLGRSNLDKKITIANLISGISGLVSVTYSAAQTLITNQTLIAGRFYLITDKADSGIILQATSTTTFSTKGEGLYLVPDYQSSGTLSGSMKGVWHSALSALTANISIAIYNGSHWRNLTGNVGTAPDGDAVNWVLLSKTTANGYILNSDVITYDFGNDSTVLREDKYGNVISSSSIATWQWGEDAVSNNIVTGIQGEVNTINQRGNINGNTFIDSIVTIGNSNRGTITSSLFKTGPFDELVASIDNNKTIKGCTFNFIDSGVTIDPTLSYRGLTMDFDIQKASITDGQTVTILSVAKKVVIDEPGGPIATATINLTGDNLYDGKPIQITSTNAITTVTWGVTTGTATISGAPTGLTDTGVAFCYDLTDNIYYRIG